MNRKINDFKHSRLYEKYGEFIRYALVGAVTTVINFGSYALLYRVAKADGALSNTVSVVSANIYAYIGDKKHVFKTHCGNIVVLLEEICLFFFSRAATIIMELSGVPIVVSLLDESPLLAKLEVVIVVVMINYVLSKFIIFRRRGRSGSIKEKFRNRTGK